MTFPLDLSLFSKIAAMQILFFSTPLSDGRAHGDYQGVDISRPHREVGERLPRTLRRPRKKCRGRSRVVNPRAGCSTSRISVLKSARNISLELFSLAELPESEVVFELN